MKKISILLIAVVASLATYAQQWVSTSPANKVAILEEFTGRNCTWCPDGHEISDKLKKDNPGKFYAINIHAGSFAPTSAPNYTTTVGTAIDGAAGVAGYPAGTVNRNSSPWASDRGTWTGKVATVTGESSPVNVFVKSSVNYTTRMLTTEVEVYYTGNGPGTSNKLTVALLQNGILGPQSGMDKYPEKIVGTQYQHEHMLRMHLTSGSWGETLTDITTGKYTKKTYNSVLPANINGIPLDIYSLEVVAFVSEANNNILSGHGTEVTHNNPNLIDLSLKDSSILPVRGFLEPETKWCENKLTPRVVVTNNSATVTATAFTVTATVNGVATPRTFTGSLAPGASTVLTWNEIQANASGIFTYKVEGFTNINGGTVITDVKTGNNSYSTNLIGIKPNAFSTFNQDFEGSVVPNSFIDNSENSAFSIVTNTAGLGAESSKNALRMPLHSTWQVSGLGLHYVMGEANLVGVTSPSLTYYYAYSNTGEESSSAPTIKVSYSTDCGTNWIDVDTKTATVTGTAAANSFYVPVSAHYKKIDVNLTPLIGKKCLIRLTGIPGNGGNSLYLDQISLKSSGGTGGGGGGGGGSASKIMDDSTRMVVSTVNLTTTEVDIPAYFKNLTNNDNVTWVITDIKMASGWTFTQICDAACYENALVGTRKSFKYTTTEFNNLKPTIKHDKKEGYGFVGIRTFKTSDSAGTVSNTKITLFVTKSSASIVSADASEKVLHYFDKKIFVDTEFNGAQLEVYDLNGKSVLSAKVNSDNIDFTPLTNGIYIARISKDGEVLKSHKFTTAK
jgi:hypothetical protein